MEKPNIMESVEPCSGQYSLKADLRLNAWMLVAAVTHLAVQFVIKTQTEWGPLARGLLALAPLIPGLLYVRSWMRFIRGLDEFQRRIQLEAFLFAALGTVILGAVVSSLNAHGVSTGFLKHGLGLGASFMAMLCFWSVGWGIAKGRYK
jgi:hypothetical protein